MLYVYQWHDYYRCNLCSAAGPRGFQRHMKDGVGKHIKKNMIIAVCFYTDYFKTTLDWTFKFIG